jgi:tetratricopeptide (TPR) repeat protein
LGSLRQDHADGSLTLEQNDGTRRIYWSQGEIVYLQSDVAGEQFGNYLLRQGILDFPALSELLANEERFRLGEKVVQWGLMTTEERDLHLHSLQKQVMIHALEHPIIELDWKPGVMRGQLSEDLQFKVDHRHFIWSTFHEAHNLGDLCDLLFDEPNWKWIAAPDLLNRLGDLPLTPQVAYALSFWGPEPVGYETFLSLSGMDEEDGARLLVALWALGGLTLCQGQLPILARPLPPPPATPDLPTPPTITMPLPEPTPNKTLSPLTFTNQEVSTPGPLDFLPEGNLPVIELNTPFPALPETAAPPAPEEEKFQEPPTVRARKYVLKAKTFLVQDRTAEAIRLLEQSVKLDPDSEQAYEAWLLLGKHRLSNPAWSNRAIEALQAASKLQPKSAEPWALMGEIYHRKSFRANARACFKRALELDPSVAVPVDVNLKEEIIEPDERNRPGLLDRFKAILGRTEKS